MKKILIAMSICLAFFACKNDKKENTTVDTNEETTVETPATDFEIIPISHATMVLKWNGKTIYVDPVGGAELFANYDNPDIVLVTDIHGDHLNVETLEGLNLDNATLIVPSAVNEKTPQGISSQIMILNNGNTADVLGFNIEAIPMYNLREEALNFHTKGRGNGYVIENDGKRVYISGDTEDIPEMRSLENIDIAFVCMNLPYTMTEESAAAAVLDFKPKTVLPYHYRGKDKMSDVFKFKNLVNAGDDNIEVLMMDWYPEQ